MNFATYPAKRCGTSVITLSRYHVVNFFSRYFYRHLIALVIWLRLSAICSCQPIDVIWLFLLSDCTYQLSTVFGCFLLSADGSCQINALVSWIFCQSSFLAAWFLLLAYCSLFFDCFGLLIALVRWFFFSSDWSSQLIAFFSLLLLSVDCSCQPIAFFSWLLLSADYSCQLFFQPSLLSGWFLWTTNFPWSFDCYGQLIVPVS